VGQIDYAHGKLQYSVHSPPPPTRHYPPPPQRYDLPAKLAPVLWEAAPEWGAAALPKAKVGAPAPGEGLEPKVNDPLLAAAAPAPGVAPNEKLVPAAGDGVDLNVKLAPDAACKLQEASAACWWSA